MKDVRRTEYDYSHLLGRMKELGITQSVLAERAEMSPTSLNEKLNGKRYFNQHQMIKIMVLLNLPLELIPYYFFEH